jgi:hypothetical protein
MANSGADSNKSQFFITYSKQAHLDSKYTIFGKVIDGADSTLDAMERVPVNNKNRPLTDIRLNKVSSLPYAAFSALTFCLRSQFMLTPSPISYWFPDEPDRTRAHLLYTIIGPQPPTDRKSMRLSNDRQ